MKTKVVLLSIFLPLIFLGKLAAQDNISYGIGYFGETIAHPGFYLQTEFSEANPKKISFPIRTGVGYYLHKRSHQAAFVDANVTMRYTPKENFYMGIGGGLGLMASWYHSDHGVYEVDHEGNVTEGSNFAGVDFMPNIHVEFGQKIVRTEKHEHSVWVRPSVFIQTPHNAGFGFHYSLAVGYSIRFLKN